MTNDELPEHYATTHRRSVALVAHARAGDQDALVALTAEIRGPEMAGATILSLCKLVNMVLTDFAPDPEGWLRQAMLHLAAMEGQDPPTRPDAA